MANTDSAYFIPLYNFIVDNSIYIPKIPNQRAGWYYMDFIQSQNPNSDLELNYKKFIKGYNTKIQLLNLDLEWIYYYVYVILFCDYGISIEKKLYNGIIEKILEGDFVKQDKINAIKQIMLKSGKTPDIINGWMEGSILSLLQMMIELDMEEDFKKIVNDIRYSTIEWYRDIIPHLIERMDKVKNEDKYSKYFDILRGKTTHKVELGKYILYWSCYHHPDQITLQMKLDDLEYSCVIAETYDHDVHYLEELVNYFVFAGKSGFDQTEFEITFSFGKLIKINLQNIYDFNLELVEKKFNLSDYSIDKTFTFERYDPDDLDNKLTIRLKKYWYDSWIIYAFDSNDYHWKATSLYLKVYKEFENILELVESNNLGIEYDELSPEDKNLILFDKSNNLDSTKCIVLSETNVYAEPIKF